MDFIFQGERIFESTGVKTKELAKQVYRRRLLALEEGRAGIKKPVAMRTFKAASDTWLEMKAAGLEANTTRIERTNLTHLLPTFGKIFCSEITPEMIASYQKERVAEDAANKTVNLEVGTLRAVLIYTGQWEALRPNVKMLKAREDVGKALSTEEETVLLEACAASRSRSLVPFVLVALYTGRRFGVIRKLKWENIGFTERTIKWGKGKSKAGDYQVLPMGRRVVDALTLWAENFPDRKPGHYVFPMEKVGMSGHRFDHGEPVYTTTPHKAMGSNKVAWKEAKKRAGWILAGRPEDPAAIIDPLVCRIHDLRHTASSRMQADGVPLSQIAQMMGWSASQTVLMARRYGHFDVNQLRGAAESMGQNPVIRGEISASRHFPRLKEAAFSVDSSKLLN